VERRGEEEEEEKRRRLDKAHQKVVASVSFSFRFIFPFEV